MSTYPAPVLETKNQEVVALEGVNIEAKLHDLICQVEVSQKYRNIEKVNIEAVYTFPLPLDAVLLNFEVVFKDRTLKGVVIEKKAAEREYEGAITDGHAAFMLQQVEPGLYTMNVGNLLPGETVTIRCTYAICYKWQGDSLRFYLPTTISPRYGEPHKAGFEPHQVPEYDLENVNAFALQIKISGLLKSALLDSPSHKTIITRAEGVISVDLDGGRSEMDRDFILNIKSSNTRHDSAVYDRDIEGYALLATFNPRLSSSEDPSPKSIKIIVDCSGSMGGDSIAQAREALWRILDSLRPQDYFNIIAFGSSHKIVFKEQIEATQGNLKTAREFVRKLDANMGGTEIGKALSATFRIKCREKLAQDVLLITDGEVYEWKTVVRKALSSKHRIFTVGVGSAVSEAFVSELADETGGASEFATPRENMADKIYRHFKRIYAQSATDVSILWPSKPALVIPEQINSVFDGDTVHVFARFGERPEGGVSLCVVFPNGVRSEQKAQIVPFPETKDNATGPGPLARLTADALMKTSKETKDIIEIATAYQLMSPHTNYLVVDERLEQDRAVELPELRTVPQMLAAGWGARDTAQNGMVLAYISCNMMQLAEEREHSELLDALMKCDAPSTRPPLPGLEDMNRVLEKMEAIAQSWAHRGHDFRISGRIGRDILQYLDEAGIPEEILRRLDSLFGRERWCMAVIIMFLYYLCRTPVGQSLPKTMIENAFRDLRVNERLEYEMDELISRQPF
jgi:Ca-activated chloride channel homolog